MKFTTCYHPRLIRNKYDGKQYMTPCRKCVGCRNAYQLQWVKRLQNHMQAHRYTVFFTLTYAPENVPTLVFDDDGNLVSKDVNRSFVIGKNHAIRRVIENDNIKFEFKDKTYNEFTTMYLDSVSEIHYARVKDAQNFIKRLRRKIDGKEKISYFMCSEYGPKTYRPHYHGLLFFNSKALSEKIFEFISASWTFGFTHSDFGKSKSTEYVAKYVTGSSYLPQIFDDKKIRPFFLCSRKPIIGSDAYNLKDLRQVFDKASPVYRVYDIGKKCISYVPLLRSLESRLFPRCQGFGKISHTDRITLYRFGQKVFEYYKSKGFEVDDISFDMFLRYVSSLFPVDYSKTIDLVYKNDVFDYVNTDLDFLIDTDYKGISFASSLSNIAILLKSLGMLDSGYNNKYNSLINYFYLSKHVYVMLNLLNCKIEYYVSKIEEYYCNKDYYNLRCQLEFEQSYDGNVQELFNIFQLDLIHAIAKDFWSCESDSLHLNMKTFNVDYQKLHPVGGVNYDYLNKFVYTNTKNYRHHVAVSNSLFESSLKTKSCNDSTNLLYKDYE